MRATTLNLEADVYDGLANEAEKRRISLSAAANELLSGALSIAKENAAEDEEIFEPEVSARFPTTMDEINERAARASSDLYYYFKFAEKNAPLDSGKCDKICLLIALAALDKAVNFGLSTSNFREDSIKILSRHSRIGIPALRKEVHSLHQRLVVPAANAKFEAPIVQQEPAQLNEWKLIKNVISAAQDNGSVEIGDLDIANGLPGDRAISRERIAEVMRGLGYIGKQTSTKIVFDISEEM